MIINKIYVNNFRNIKEAELDFTDGCNVFYGNNAQGKTNMLEAVSICLGNSFRQAKPASFIPFSDNNKNTCIYLKFTLDKIENRENTVKFELSDKGKPTVELNGIKLKNAFELYGELKYVVFIPEDLNLIKGVPELRRNYIDNIAILQNKSHKRILYDYKNALNQKNALNLTGNAQNNDISEVWNDVLTRQGINLTFGRVKFYDMLKKYAVELYSELSDNTEIIDIIYQSNVFGNIIVSSDIDFNNTAKLYNQYIEILKNTPLAADLKTRVGAHKDDIIFTLGGRNVREYGSQGQLRSIALVMKLAEAETIRNYNKERPVILLDEVLGELDINRRKFIIKHFAKSQVFITSCNHYDFENSNEIKVWETENGVFTEMR